MKEKILEVIERYGGGVTFAQLDNIKGFSGDREYVLEGPDFSNIVLWSGLSSEAIEAIQSMRVNQDVILCSTPFLTYLADGMSLSYPVAKTRRHYKEPRWSPCVIWTAEQAKKGGFFEKWKCKNR